MLGDGQNEAVCLLRDPEFIDASELQPGRKGGTKTCFGSASRHTFYFLLLLFTRLCLKARFLGSTSVGLVLGGATAELLEPLLPNRCGAPP